MKLKYISWLPSVLLMVIIFLFSSKPAINSNESSLTIADNILRIYENITGNSYQADIRMDRLDLINHIIRKGAHFCEYAVLAATFAFHLYVWKQKRRWLFLLPVILSSLYAASDEFHQIFVAGRSGQLSDVLLDSAGAFTGALLFLLCSLLFTGKKKGKKSLLIRP